MYMSYYVCIYVIHCSYHASLITIKSLSFRLFEKAKYFQACSNKKFHYFFPLLHIVACKQETQKTPRGTAKLKNLMLVNFLQ